MKENVQTTLGRMKKQSVQTNLNGQTNNHSC